MESGKSGLGAGRRCDLALPQDGLARSRSHAQALIEAGTVVVHRNGSDIVVPSASFLVLPTDRIFVTDSDLNRFVSRAGIKLENALKHTDLSITGFECLDVGQSTGGFTDCLLQKGAAKVVGVDVGREQLDVKLKSDPRVIPFENINARDSDWPTRIAQALPSGGFDLIVVDVSFISLTYVLPSCLTQVPTKSGAKLIALFKPQFEVGPDGIDGRGIVKDPSLIGPVRDKVLSCVTAQGWKVLDFFTSGLSGKEGNQEYFVYASK